MWKERVLYMINWFNIAPLWQENRWFCHFFSVSQHVSVLIPVPSVSLWPSTICVDATGKTEYNSLQQWGCVDQQEGWANSGTKLDLPPRVRWLKMLLWSEGCWRTWGCLNLLCLTRNETELIHHWQNLIFSTRPMQMSIGPVVLPIKAEKQMGSFFLPLKKAAKCSCVNIF